MRYTLVTVTWLHDSVYHGRSQKKFWNCFSFTCAKKNGLKKFGKKIFQLELLGSSDLTPGNAPVFSSFPKGFPYVFRRWHSSEASITKPLPGGPGSCCWRNRRPFMKGFLLGRKMDALKKKKSHDIKVLIDDDFMVCFFVFNLVVAGWNPWWTRKIFGLPRWKIFQEDKRFRCGTPKNCVFQVSGPEVCLKSTFCFRL